CIYGTAHTAIQRNGVARSPVQKVKAGITSAAGRQGPLSGTSTLAGIFVRSAPRFDRPDLQFNISLYSIDRRDRDGIIPHAWPGFMITPVHLQPEGRGRVSLKSADPFAAPKIEFKFIKTAYDVAAILFGARLYRKIAVQPSLQPDNAKVIVPAPSVTIQKELI